MPDIREGSFCLTRGKALVDFWHKLGASAEDAKKGDGSHWKVCITKMCEKSWRMMMWCKEFPEWNFVQCYTENEEMCLDLPVYGGATKVKLTCPDANTLKLCTESDKYGRMESVMVFTEQGYTMSMKSSKGGATLSENWCRWVNEEGSYRYVCNEGGDAYLKGLGHKESFEKLSKESCFRLTNLGGDCWDFTERFGGQTFSVQMKMDVEFDYNVPGWERKMIATRLAPGKIKTIMRCPKTGGVEEWTRTITSCGKVVMCGEDKKTGNKCKIMYEKFSCPVGIWRCVFMAGEEELALACGIPAQLARDMGNDCDHKVTIKEQGGYMHVSSDSKYNPYSIIYKPNEEFEFTIPSMPEPIKGIETVCGDDYTMVQTTGKHTVITRSKVTNSYMVCEARMKGTNIRSKIIYMRCCGSNKP